MCNVLGTKPYGTVFNESELHLNKSRRGLGQIKVFVMFCIEPADSCDCLTDKYSKI